MTTNAQQAAQLVAEKINSHSEEEIEAMIVLISEIYGKSLRAMVGNLYAQINPSVMTSGIKVG